MQDTRNLCTCDQIYMHRVQEELQEIKGNKPIHISLWLVLLLPHRYQPTGCAWWVIVVEGYVDRRTMPRISNNSYIRRWQLLQPSPAAASTTTIVCICRWQRSQPIIKPPTSSRPQRWSHTNEADKQSRCHGSTSRSSTSSYNDVDLGKPRCLSPRGAVWIDSNLWSCRHNDQSTGAAPVIGDLGS
jgi:hypothetical protein